MKSTLDTLEGLNRKLKIDVPADKVKDTFTKMYQDIQRKADIKGFRKGKAPISTIRTMYNEKISQDVLQQLIAESYQKAIEEHSLDPVSQPHVHIDNYNEDENFQYSAEIEVRPEIIIKKLDGLVVEKEILSIENQQIDKTLKSIQENMKEMVPVFEERPAQEGDFVKIDFEGFLGEEPLPGGKAEGHVLELGSHSFIEGFEEKVVGMKTGGEKSIELQFPVDYHAKNLQGKTVKFNVKLNEISKKTLPELNDELAKKINEKFSSLDELKNAIKEDIEKNEQKRIQSDLSHRILRVLTKENPIEVPSSLTKDQKVKLLEDVEQRLKQQGIDETGIKDYKLKWDADFDKTALFMVQSSFLIDHIAEKHSLRPIAGDLETKISGMAKEVNMDIEKIKEFYNDNERKSSLHFQIMEEKVISFLLEKADIKEVTKDKLTDEPPER